MLILFFDVCCHRPNWSCQLFYQPATSGQWHKAGVDVVRLHLSVSFFIFYLCLVFLQSSYISHFCFSLFLLCLFRTLLPSPALLFHLVIHLSKCTLVRLNVCICVQLSQCYLKADLIFYYRFSSIASLTLHTPIPT